MMRWLANLFGFGRIAVIDDSGPLQLVQFVEGAIGDGMQDRVSDKVRRVTDFGFASSPPLGSEAIALRRAANRSHSVVFATSHRPSRPKNLKPGDAGIYDVRGAKVMLTADGLLIDCAGLPAAIQNASTVTIAASDKIVLDGDVEMTKTLKVSGEITADGDGSAVGLGALRDAYNAHKHGDVKAGTDTSGGTDHEV
jgi:phage baseplate assembly protein V